MTFFLNDAPAPAPRGPDAATSDFAQGLGAAYRSAMLHGDAWFRSSRETASATQAVVNQSVQILGESAAREALKSAGLPDPGPALTRTDIVWDDLAQKAIMGAARADAVRNAGKWQGVDVGLQGVDKTVNDKLQAESQADAEVLASMPSALGAAVAGFVGGAVGAVNDPRQLPFLVAGGGGGSVLKILGREFLLGVASQAVVEGSNFDMAKRLNEPDPNVVQDLLMAGVGGAVLGGGPQVIPKVFGPAARALAYIRGRERLPAGAITPSAHEAAVGAAEDALIAGDNPMAPVMQIMREAPLKEQPLIPDLPDATAQFDAAFADSNARAGIVTQPVETQVIPPQAAPNESVPTDQLVSSADRAIKAAESNMAQPTMDAPVKPKGSPPPSLKDFIRTRGVWTGDPMYADVKAAYSRPGMFRKERMQYSSAGNNGGGWTLDDLAGAAHEAGFFTERPSINDLLDALGRDARAKHTGEARVYAFGDMGDGVAWKAYQEHQQAYAQFLDTGKVPEYRSPIEDVKAKTPAPDGLMFTARDIDLMHFGGDAHGDITRELKFYAADRGFKLLPREYSEIADTLVRNQGGDAALLMERAMERELSDAEYAYLRQTGEWPASVAEPPPGFLGESAGPAGQPEASRGNAPEPGTGGAQPANLERTSAGQQHVVPGVAPVTDRQRLEAQMSAPLQGGQKAMDAGLFDMGARQQIDMFDDPGAAKARPAQMEMVSDLRDMVAKGEAGTVDLGDGARSLESVVDELEKDADFEDVLNACRGGT